MSNEPSFNAARRRLLRLFGLGAAGTAIGAVVASDQIFAKQFVDNGPFVAPAVIAHWGWRALFATRQPIYEDAGRIDVASGLPTVTSGCGNCPKKDDTGS